MAADKKPDIPGVELHGTKDDRTLPADRVAGSSPGASDVSAGRDSIFFVALQTTRMPMTVTDPRLPDNPIVFANRAFTALTGYTSDEIVGRNCRFLQGPETDPVAVSDLRRAIEGRREHVTEILNYRKDGYSFWNALLVSPVFDADGELAYFFASQLDVSRRREAEDALRQAQKMEVLGRLTGGIAHDFNNLLQVMSGYLELLDSGLRKPTLDLPKLRRGIEHARGAADRASALTQQLLGFSRKQRRDGRTINLNDLVASIQDLATHALGEGITFEVKLASRLPNCQVDPTQIEVALLNLLIDARRAVADRTDKRIAIETRDVIVSHDDLSLHPNIGPGHYCMIAMTDNGSGLPRDVVERATDPFFTAKDEDKGSGLSLSTVYGFVRQSGGLTRISTVEGVGTTVRLYFPAAAGTSTLFSVPRGRALDRPGTETILVVESRPNVAELARIILENQGYIVRLASDADAAMKCQEAEDIDLLFADLVVPGKMDGVDLAREARRRRPSLKVLLTTAYTQASTERTEAGGSEFDILDKPYGRTELVRKVRMILDGPTGVN